VQQGKGGCLLEVGHYHIQKNKTDPGPAFDWSRIVEGARAKMKP
jgi:N-acetyl-anhydromuramyl-L-alanine amidase AmpD